MMLLQLRNVYSYALLPVSGQHNQIRATRFVSPWSFALEQEEEGHEPCSFVAGEMHDDDWGWMAVGMTMTMMMMGPQFSVSGVVGTFAIHFILWLKR